MRLEIEGDAVARLSDVRDHIEHRAAIELARYGGYVEELRVRVIGRGCSPGHLFHCGIALTVAHDDGGRTYVGTGADGNDVYRVIELVLADASSVVGEEVARGLVAQEEAGVLLLRRERSVGAGARRSAPDTMQAAHGRPDRSHRAMS